MYAINHAATALVLKKNAPQVKMRLLLVSVQFVELLWVVFNYTGIEHYSISEGKVHLDYLPWSHSILSALIIALLAFIVFRYLLNQKTAAIAIAIGILSHIVLDMLIHEKDIALSPFQEHPVYGSGIIRKPVINFIIELVYGIACCYYFGAKRALYVVVIVFNLLDLPVMLASGKSLDVFRQYPFLLPSFILFQILITWYFVGRYSNKSRER